MTLPVVPGNSMSFSQINTELGLSSTTTISLNQASVRTLAGVGASPATIAITNLSGKSNEFTFTISTNQSNANLATLATAAGWNGSTKLIATINSGVQITSTSNATPALTISGSFPGTVRLNNAGTIVGRGGTGANGANRGGGQTGGNAGTGLAVSSAVTVNNTGTIGGGGGGGAGSTDAYGSGSASSGGGGAGFGPAGVANNYGSSATAGGLLTGGTYGQYGAQRGGVGGAAGASGGDSTDGCGGPAYSGGAGGNCITGNSNITYVAVGTRLGAIS